MEQGSYRVRIASGELELEIEAPDPDYVDSKLIEMLGWAGFQSPQNGWKVAQEPEATPKKPVSLAEHVKKVSPAGGLEHVLAVGYYLEHYREMAGGFRRRDLGQAFKSIKYHHSNPGVPIASGRKQGLLMDGAEVDKIRLSESADTWVRARLSEE